MQMSEHYSRQRALRMLLRLPDWEVLGFRRALPRSRTVFVSRARVWRVRRAMGACCMTVRLMSTWIGSSGLDGVVRRHVLLRLHAAEREWHAAIVHTATSV